MQPDIADLGVSLSKVGPVVGNQAGERVALRLTWSVAGALTQIEPGDVT
jgi:hypothetical protein